MLDLLDGSVPASDSFASIPATHTGPRTVDTSAGSMVGVLSAQWSSRPDDQRFLSLDSLYEAVQGRRAISRQFKGSGARLRIEAEGTALKVAAGDHTFAPTHYAFGQLAAVAEAPAGYLRRLPAPLAAENLRYGLANRHEPVKLLARGDELAAVTGQDYGRVWDAEVVDSVRRLNVEAGGTWKIPGVMERFGTYDPSAPVTSRSTTLYASDRDVWMFLCDDLHPVEVGKLPSGEPDLMFRGFYVSNSETGAGTLLLGAMMLRAVCCNRNLWGVEGFHEVRIRHSKFAPNKFVGQYRRDLVRAMQGATDGVRARVLAAKAAKFGGAEPGDRLAALNKAGLTKSQAVKVAAIGGEAGGPIENVWDAVQAITSFARDIPHADDRFALERVGGALMDKVRLF